MKPSISLYKKNMRALKKHFPHIYRALLEPSPKDLKLVTRRGQLFIASSEQTVSIDEILKVVSTQVENFEESSVTFRLKEACNHESSVGLQEKFLSKVCALGKQFTVTKAVEKEIRDRYFPVLVVFGVGSGFHIEKLLDRFEVDFLILAESHVSFLKPSLYLIDWEQILEKFSKEGKKMLFLVSYQPKALANKVYLSLTGLLSPAFAIRLPVYLHHEGVIFSGKEFVSEFSEELRQEVLLSNSNLGFIDDEIISLKHTVKNVVKESFPVLKYLPSLNENDREIPVFICGSGPSLDKLIDKLKEFKDRAIIASCGTALKSLISYGIKPDIHFEMERTKITYDLLVSYNLKELKNIPLIGLHNLYSDVFSLFDTKGIIVKIPDVCDSLFPKHIQRFDKVNPTVTNMAISFFSKLRFKEIYLIGLDYGFWDEKHHHSKQTIYYKGEKFKKLEIKGNIEIEGNFGGKVYTTSVFLYSKKITEMIIRSYKEEIDYYNPNFGANIEGAFPLRKEDFVLGNKPVDKSVIYKLFAYFSPLNEDEKKEFLTNIDELKKASVSFLQEQKVLIENHPVNNIKELCRLIHKMHLNIRKLDYKNSGANILVRGTLYHLTRTILYFAWQVEESKFEKYISEALRITLEFIEEAKETIRKLKA